MRMITDVDAFTLRHVYRSDQPGYIVRGNFEPAEVEIRPTSDGLAVFWADWEDTQ